MAPNAKHFDISSLGYQDFLLYFFTNPNSDKWDESASGEQYWLSEIKRPEVILSHLTRMCTEFGELAKNIPLETLEAGLDGMLAPAYFQLQTVLWSDSVPLNERIACIESMYRVFADFVSLSPADMLPGSLYMLWDHICTAFWFHQSHHKKHASESYSELADDDKRLVDAMFVTLCTILELDDDRAKSCALHGLGHLHHPGVAAIVQRFIGSLRDDAKVPEAIDWLEKCRDSTVM